MKLDKIIAVRTNKTIYRDKNITVKVFNNDYLKSDIFNEALNQVMAKEAGINVPEIYSVELIDNKWSISSEYIEGKTISALMKENPEKRDEYFNLFVKLQVDINKSECPHLRSFKNRTGKKIFETEIDSVTKYDLHSRLNDMKNDNFICHGDFLPGNVVIDSNKKAYILDWSHVTRGNAEIDAATTYLMFISDGEKELAEEYIDLYSKKSKIDKDIIKKWIQVVAASQLDNCTLEKRKFLLSVIKNEESM